MGNEQFGTVDAVSGLNLEQRRAVLGKPTIDSIVSGLKAGKYKNIVIDEIQKKAIFNVYLIT